MLAHALSVKLRSGKERVGSVMLPETIDEALTLIGEPKEVLKILCDEIIKRGKKRLKARPPKKTLLIKLDSLTPEQRATLVSCKLI